MDSREAEHFASADIATDECVGVTTTITLPNGMEISESHSVPSASPSLVDAAEVYIRAKHALVVAQQKESECHYST